MKEEKKNKKELFLFTSFDLWCLGITIVIGGQYFGWNNGFKMGLGSYLIGYLLISISYIILSFSLAELAGIIPFSGGSYTYVLLSFGNYIGFLVGAFESIALILYTSSSTIFFGEMITNVLNTDSNYEPLYWLFVYVISVFICIYGGHIFWMLNKVLAIISIFIIILYIFCSIPFVDFEKKSDPKWFVGGIDSFLENIVFILWFFIGIEYVNNGTKDCQTPTISVPKGYVSGILTLIASSICIIFISISLQSWESLSQELQPLNQGFSKAFSCSSRVASILSLPATFATNFGFIYSYGRILYSLGQANIFSPIFGYHLFTESTPDVALIIGSLLGYAFCCLFFFAFFPKPDLFELCGLASTFVYCTILGSYIIFSIHFSHLERNFQSIFGIIGSIFAILVFLLCFISIAVFQANQTSLYYFIGIFITLNLYYYFIIRHNEFFCTEEQFINFSTYVTKYHIHNSNTPKTFKHALSLLNPISRSNKIRILPDIPEPNLEKQPIHSLIEEIQRSFRFNPSGNDNGELECNP